MKKLFLAFIICLFSIPIFTHAIAEYEYADIKKCYLKNVESTNIVNDSYTNNKSACFPAFDRGANQIVDKERLENESACDDGFELYQIKHPYTDELGNEWEVGSYGCRKKTGEVFINETMYCRYDLNSYKLMLVYKNNKFSIKTTTVRPDVEIDYMPSYDDATWSLSYTNYSFSNTNKVLDGVLWGCPNYVEPVLDSNGNVIEYSFYDKKNDNENGYSIYTKDDTDDSFYASLCSTDNKSTTQVRLAFKMAGYVIQIIKWLIPILIVVLGMVDFGQAVISNDEKALSKSLASLTKRLIAGVVVFFIPSIIMGILSVIEITKGIEKESNSNFGACTKCLFDPFDSCDIPEEYKK